MALNKSLPIITIFSLLLSISTEAHFQTSQISAAPASSPSSSPSPSPSPSPLPSTTTTTTTTNDIIPESFLTISELSTTNEIIPASLPTIPRDLQVKVSKVVETNMIATMKKTQDFMTVLEKKMDDPEKTSSAEECLKTCQEVYETAIEDIKSSIDDMHAGDYFKANVDISAVSTNVDTCEECFNEMVGEDPELIQFDEWVRGITGECLGALEQFSS